MAEAMKQAAALGNLPVQPRTKVIKYYLHGDKDTNWELGERIGLTEEAIRNHFRGACYEVEVDLEVDMLTGESKIIAVDGRKLL